MPTKWPNSMNSTSKLNSRILSWLHACTTKSRTRILRVTTQRSNQSATESENRLFVTREMAQHNSSDPVHLILLLFTLNSMVDGVNLTQHAAIIRTTKLVQTICKSVWADQRCCLSIQCMRSRGWLEKMSIRKKQPCVITNRLLRWNLFLVIPLFTQV